MRITTTRACAARLSPLLGVLLPVIAAWSFAPSAPAIAHDAPRTATQERGDRLQLWLGGRQAEARERARLTVPGSPRQDLVPSPLLESLAGAVNIDSMMASLGAISVDIRTRYYRTSGMQQATQLALDRFLAYGCDDAYFDTFTYNGYSIRNVIGVKRGSVYPSRIYMICGHLDSTSPQHDTLAPGAEDNGSGAMGVLEAARLLAPLRTEATLYFVCFTAEEQGLIGSEHLASIAEQEQWDLRGVLNMDMVGYDAPGDPSLWIEGFHSNAGSVALMDLLESVADAYTDLEVYRYPGEGWGSDHETFNAHGFPAILAIDYNWDSYACYHETCDEISNIVPYQYRRMLVAVTVLGAQLAGLDASLGLVDGTADRTDSTNDAGIRLEIPGTGYAPVLSGAGGSFRIPDLLPGRYTLRASAYGYRTAEIGFTVIGGQPTHVVIHIDPEHPMGVDGAPRAGIAGIAVEPNPFTGAVRIRIDLTDDAVARAPEAGVMILDAAGRRVRELAAAPASGPGTARILSWDARDDRGREVPAGMYWVRVRAWDRQIARPILRVR